MEGDAIAAEQAMVRELISRTMPRNQALPFAVPFAHVLPEESTAVGGKVIVRVWVAAGEDLVEVIYSFLVPILGRLTIVTAAACISLRQ